MKNRKKIEKNMIVFILAYIFILIINYCFKDCYNINNDFYEISKKNNPIKISYSDIEEIENLLETEVLIIGTKKIEIESFSQKAEIDAIGVYGRYEKFFNSHLKQGVFIQDYHDEINNSAVMSENLLSRMTGIKNVLGEQISDINKYDLDIVGIMGLGIRDYIFLKDKVYVPFKLIEDLSDRYLVDGIYIEGQNKNGEDISTELIKLAMESIDVSENEYRINDLKIKSEISLQTITGLFSEKLVTLEFYIEGIKKIFREAMEEKNNYKSEFFMYSKFLTIILRIIMVISIINFIFLLKNINKIIKGKKELVLLKIRDKLKKLLKREC